MLTHVESLEIPRYSETPAAVSETTNSSMKAWFQTARVACGPSLQTEVWVDYKWKIHSKQSPVFVVDETGYNS